MQIVLDFLKDIYKNAIVLDRKYGIRIPIEDGFQNSYLGFDVDVETYNKSKKLKISALRIYRHTNSENNLSNVWGFEYGNIIYPICDNPNVPLKFSSYGKTAFEAQKEAQTYFNKLKREIQKVTAKIRIEEAETVESEIAQLTQRLSELQGS